jgi:hypothetical protein
VLFLPEAASSGSYATGLVDITGRDVTELRPGPNDVSGLSPGVYFVRYEPSTVTKVVILR